MAHPDPGVLAWASAVLGSEVAVVRSLRLGGTPWLLRGGGRNAVLRVIAAERAGETQTEVAAMTHVAQAAQAGLPVPELLGYDLAEQTGYALMLTGQVAGSGVIPAEPDPERLRALGAVAARISSVALSPTRALPVRRRPIEAEDFARLRREQGASDLLRAAEAAVAEADAARTDAAMAEAGVAGTGAAEAGVGPGDGRAGLVHGDLWYGNTLWDDEGRLTAIIDWDCAGAGPAGIDLGSLRIDAALCYGLPAADDILRGWEAEAGRPGCDIPYWDVVAALSSPPDMGWFPESMAAQGRPDLTHAVMLERRDAFLAAALSQLEAAS
jgi:aminoglycoside phosphotransferase (APT) family kinase protein